VSVEWVFAECVARCEGDQLATNNEFQGPVPAFCPGHGFGSALGVIDRSALIGASWYTREFTQDGIAYAYELVPEPSATLLGATVLVVLSALARRKPVDIDRG
jgi:hypothetical protein